MGRIKQGLDYFPLSTDFMHDRIVRRVMKREGDSAFTVLIILCLIFIRARATMSVPTLISVTNFPISFSVRTTIPSAVSSACFLSTGFFDSALYERYSILTSEDVQRQYLFITKRRSGTISVRIIVCCRKERRRNLRNR